MVVHIPFRGADKNFVPCRGTTGKKTWTPLRSGTTEKLARQK